MSKCSHLLEQQRDAKLVHMHAVEKYALTTTIKASVARYIVNSKIAHLPS